MIYLFHARMATKNETRFTDFVHEIDTDSKNDGRWKQDETEALCRNFENQMACFYLMIGTCVWMAHSGQGELHCCVGVMVMMSEWPNIQKHWWWMNDPTLKNTGDDEWMTQHSKTLVMLNEWMTQHSKTFFVLLLAENKFGMPYHWTLAFSLISTFRFQRCVFEVHRWDDSCVSPANISHD